MLEVSNCATILRIFIIFLSNLDQRIWKKNKLAKMQKLDSKKVKVQELCEAVSIFAQETLINM